MRDLPGRHLGEGQDGEPQGHGGSQAAGGEDGAFVDLRVGGAEGLGGLGGTQIQGLVSAETVSTNQTGPARPSVDVVEPCDRLCLVVAVVVWWQISPANRPESSRQPQTKVKTTDKTDAKITNFNLSSEVNVSSGDMK